MCRSEPLRWFAVALVASAVLVGACSQKMAQQPSYRPYQPADVFADGTSARTLPADTVARGQQRADTSLFSGLSNGQEVDQLPFPVTRELLDRGQQRFEIFCVPCHGYLGDGQGMVVQRGFSPPPTFHSDRLRQAPVGHFFSIMSNGFGAMPSYAAQVPVVDRWAIVAYIRALQLSQHAALDDVPPDRQPALQQTP